MLALRFVFGCWMGLAMTTVFGADRKPNVLMIAIDDQNDWIGCLGGHALAKTPNIDALAERGTVFLNAHCQAPLCNPSRTSLLMGLRPSTTGIHGLAPNIRTLSQYKQRVSLPQHFATHGYRTAATGKIFHGNNGKGEFQVTGPGGGVGIKPKEKLIPPTPMGNHPLMDWGTFPHEDKDKGDDQITTWAVDQLKQSKGEQPFFLSVGYFLPHVPCYVTKQWMDLYPDDDSVLPAILSSDRDDTPRFSWYLHWNLPEPRLKWVQEQKQWRNLVRSYLGCISFVDYEIGRLMQALEETGQLNNTIVVLWGDHGWHLGEKGITGKNTLWERSTRVPLIFAGPGVTGRGRCESPAELLDIYPSLIELCGLSAKQDLEGHSLVPQLTNDRAERAWPAITTHNQGNHGIRTKQWRYIHYADGTEELYNHEQDPHEWHNLAKSPEMAKVLEEHRRWLPKVDVPNAPGSAQRILEYDPKSGVVIWEGEPVKPDDEIPGF